MRETGSWTPLCHLLLRVKNHTNTQVVIVNYCLHPFQPWSTKPMQNSPFLFSIKKKTPIFAPNLTNITLWSFFCLWEIFLKCEKWINSLTKTWKNTLYFAKLSSCKEFIICNILHYIYTRSEGASQKVITLSTQILMIYQ